MGDNPEIKITALIIIMMFFIFAWGWCVGYQVNSDKIQESICMITQITTNDYLKCKEQKIDIVIKDLQKW